MVFTFVRDPEANFTVPNLDQNEADNENNIQFGGLETISGGSIAIVQVQGGGTASMRITACDTDGTIETDGNCFIAGYADDEIADITTIRVFAANGDLLVETSADVTNVNGITVDFRDDGTVDVFGINDNFLIEYEAEDHQRLKVTGLGGKFDIGGIGVDRPGGAFTPVGQNVVFDDDGPTVAADGTVPTLTTVDTSVPGDTGSASFAGVFGVGFGTDGGKDADDGGVVDDDAVTYELGVNRRASTAGWSIPSPATRSTSTWRVTRSSAVSASTMTAAPTRRGRSPSPSASTPTASSRRPRTAQWCTTIRPTRQKPAPRRPGSTPPIW